jgi:hypothetical protein
MRRFFTFISPVLPVSMGIFVISCVLAGSIGPCGPNGRFGFIYLVGYPIGFIGTLVGFVLSVWKTLKHLKRDEVQKPDKKIR